MTCQCYQNCSVMYEEKQQRKCRGQFKYVYFECQGNVFFHSPNVFIPSDISDLQPLAYPY